VNILFVSNSQRGIHCLNYLQQFYTIVGVITKLQPDNIMEQFRSVLEQNCPILSPVNVNAHHFIDQIRALQPDLTVLAGFSDLVHTEFINLSSKGCINLHAGKLPEYRGSSPLNWSLINGEKEFSISIIQIDDGIDTGDVWMEKTFPITDTSTIKDLHQLANRHFPFLLVDVIREIEKGDAKPRKQAKLHDSYFPLRLPTDGTVFFDMYSAVEIHNRIRALTSPYPCVRTYYNGKKLKIVRSSLYSKTFRGEPGRIYRKLNTSILVCANDKCLWLDEIRDFSTDKIVFDEFTRYSKLATVSGVAESILEDYSK